MLLKTGRQNWSCTNYVVDQKRKEKSVEMTGAEVPRFLNISIRFYNVVNFVL
jgi:hypothetical protein